MLSYSHVEINGEIHTAQVLTYLTETRWDDRRGLFEV